MGWAIVKGCTKRQFQIANQLEVNFKLDFKKKIILEVVKFQNVLMDPNVLKKNQISLFFSISFGIILSFHKKLNLCVFPISYACLHIISYKYNYVLF